MSETPDTGGLMIAAYITTAVILLLYVVSLWRRSRRR